MSGEKTLFELTDQQISRYTVCGECEVAGINHEDYLQVYQGSFHKLADKVASFDEWGPDPEVSRQKSKIAKENYREKHRDQISARHRETTIERRVKQLKEELCRK